MTTVATGDNGRDAGGRFTTGNRFASGNPAHKRAAELRSALLNAVSPTDLKEIVAALVAAAKRGDTVAAREVLDRVLGRPAQADVLARLESLETALAERGTI